MVVVRNMYFAFEHFSTHCARAVRHAYTVDGIKERGAVQTLPYCELMQSSKSEKADHSQ